MTVLGVKMNQALNTNQDENAAVARWRTAQHQARLAQTVDILRPALTLKHAIDWDKLVDLTIDAKPTRPTYLEYPPELKEPAVIDERYVREYSAWAETVKQAHKCHHQGVHRYRDKSS